MWQASTGLTGRRGYPWWIHDGRRTLYTDGGNVRRFATEAAAGVMVAKLNRRDYGSDVMLSARRHLAAAIRMLNRATADATPDDDRIAAECDLFAVLERLGGPL